MESTQAPADADRRAASKQQPPKVRLGYGGEDDYAPIYMAAPHDAGGGGNQNLQVGVVMLLLALVLLAFGTILSGPQAIVPVGVCLAAFTLFWILLRMRVFQKRNGGFVALAAVCLLGSLVSFFQRGYAQIEALAKAPAATAPQPVAAAPAPAPAEPEVPLLTQLLGFNPAAPVAGPSVKILNDARVQVGRRMYRVTAGEVFPFLEARGGEVFFGTDELRVALPKDALEVNGLQSSKGGLPPRTTTGAAPAPEVAETPAQVTQRAQVEAIRRYPALGVKDSPENLLFLDTYRELRNAGSELLKDPEWPLDVAESLAKRQGWERSGQ